jgi:hypothetical protein
MISNDFTDNNIRTPVASARTEMLRRPNRSELWPAEPAALAPIDGNAPPASARNVSNVTQFLAVEILPKLQTSILPFSDGRQAKLQ